MFSESAFSKSSFQKLILFSFFSNGSFLPYLFSMFSLYIVSHVLLSYVIKVLLLLLHNFLHFSSTSCKPVACSSETAGRVFLPLPKIRDITPVGCFSVTGVDTGVAGTDLLAVGRPVSDVGDTPVTADVSLSAVAELLLVDNSKPGIGRAGGAGHPNHNGNFYNNNK